MPGPTSACRLIACGEPRRHLHARNASLALPCTLEGTHPRRRRGDEHAGRCRDARRFELASPRPPVRTEDAHPLAVLAQLPKRPGHRRIIAMAIDVDIEDV